MSYSLLMPGYAALHGDPAIVSAMLEQRANPNERSRNGNLSFSMPRSPRGFGCTGLRAQTELCGSRCESLVSNVCSLRPNAQSQAERGSFKRAQNLHEALQ